MFPPWSIDIRSVIGLFLGDLDQQFSEVSALEQSYKGLGGVPQPIDDVLFVDDLTFSEPGGEVFQALRVLFQVVEHDESFYPTPGRQNSD